MFNNCLAVDKNTVPFIAIATLLFVGLVVVNSLLFPPEIPDPPAGNRPADPQQVGEQKEASGESATSEPEGGGGSAQAERQDPADEPADDPPQDARPEFPRQFPVLGRATRDSGQLVVQLDSGGARVRRIFLNSRTSNGDYKYRDIQWEWAWIGLLELKPDSDGCRVERVLPGSPADQAGIRSGEIIVALSSGDTIRNEPVTGPADWLEMVKRLSRRSQLELEIRDVAGQQRTVTVQSTSKPMQVIRPEQPDQLTETGAERQSFTFSLKDRTAGVWPDLDPAMRTGNWKVNPVAAGDEQPNVVEFVWDLPRLEDGRQFQVVKRFSLPEDPAAFHVNMDLEIRNTGEAPATVNFDLWGPSGLPTEGWWYQQKIHGNTWAFFQMAGVRDILASTEAIPFRFFSGPEIVDDKESGAYGTPIIAEGLTDPARRAIRFMAGDTLYFVVAALPENGTLDCYSAFGTTITKIDQENSTRARKLTDVNSVVYSNTIALPPWDEQTGNGAWSRSFRIFAGPKVPAVLAEYGLQDARTFGWFAIFSKPLIGLLHLLHSVTLGFSWGIAIILLTVIVRSLMIPISRKAALNAQMMQHLSPEIKEIADKYKEQPEKRIQAQQELFRKYNYNPFGGCLLMFLQLPIFLGLYRGLSVDVALRDAPLIPGLQWCSNLAAPDKLFYWGDWMPSFLASETGWLGPYFNLLPILTIGLMLAQQKLFMPPATDDQSRMAQRMMKFMMIFMAFIFFKVASGLCVYFITSSIWGIVERKMLPKPELNVEKFKSRGDKSNSVFGRRKPEQESGQTDNMPLRNERALDERRQRDRQRKRKLRERQ